MQTVIDSGHSDPELNDPFLTTREVFLLKGGSASRLSAYQQLDARGRAQILAALRMRMCPPARSKPLFPKGRGRSTSNGLPMRPTLQTCCVSCAPLPTHLHSILWQSTHRWRRQRARTWSYAGYKGGSEPGVLNLTWLLTDAAGRDHALVLSWKNPEANLNQTALEMIAQRILSLPK